MNDKKTFENLSLLTKQQIIDYLKQKVFFGAPSKKDVAWFLWDVKSKDHQKKTDKYLKNQRRRALAKELDDSAVLVNTEKDFDKKVKLLAKRAGLLEKFQAELDEWGKLDDEYNKIQKLIE